jgi:hypothetical protein
MTQSDDLTRQQHDVTDIMDIDKNKDLNTPEDEDDEFLEGGEKDTDIDALHEAAFGDESDETIGDEITKDEIAVVKNLVVKQQKKKKKNKKAA